MRRHLIPGVAVACLVAAPVSSAQAEDIAQGVGTETTPGYEGPTAPGAPPDETTQITLGAGIGVAPDYEGSDDYQPIPLWNLRVQNLYDPNTFFQLRGLGFSSNLLPHPNFRLGITGQYSGERDDVDDDSVDDLGSTDDGFLLGVVAGYDFDVSPDTVVGIEVDARYDVAGDIGGLITAKAGLSPQPGRRATLGPDGLCRKYLRHRRLHGKLLRHQPGRCSAQQPEQLQCRCRHQGCRRQRRRDLPLHPYAGPSRRWHPTSACSAMPRTARSPTMRAAPTSCSRAR